MDFFNTIYNIFYLFLWNIQIVHLGFILIQLNNFSISVAFLNFLLDRFIFYVYYITCVREKFRSMNIIYMREWLSGGAPPCQGGGRGFDPRLALFYFVRKSVFIWLPFCLSLIFFGDSLKTNIFIFSFYICTSQISCPCSKLPLIHLL